MADIAARCFSAYQRINCRIQFIVCNIRFFLRSIRIIQHTLRQDQLLLIDDKSFCRVVTSAEVSYPIDQILQFALVCQLLQLCLCRFKRILGCVELCDRNIRQAILQADQRIVCLLVGIIALGCVAPSFSVSSIESI